MSGLPRRLMARGHYVSIALLSDMAGLIERGETDEVLDFLRQMIAANPGTSFEVEGER